MRYVSPLREEMLEWAEFSILRSQLDIEGKLYVKDAEEKALWDAAVRETINVIRRNFLKYVEKKEKQELEKKTKTTILLCSGKSRT